ncbi:MAG: agmatine deiminase family protein [Desulfobacterales bacterium]
MNPPPARRRPAEWEPHEAMLLAFPADGRDWPGKFGAIRWAFVEFIRRVAQSEPVLLLVASPEHRRAVRRLLRQARVPLSRIRFLVRRTNRSWMRDAGPIVVYGAGGGREALEFRFTGWAKYGNHRLDRLVPAAVARALGIPCVSPRYRGRAVVLEGGAIEVNGRGTLITTEECLLDPRTQVRNPGFGRADYEAVFREYLGVTNVIWLAEGIEGDDTHGHVDDICRFVNPTTVVACVEDDPRDPNHRRLAANRERLEGARLEDGGRLEIVPLPLPGRVDFEDLRLPASYANFLITNESVLVPTFNDPRDRLALGLLAELMPERNVIGIHALDLVWGLGTLHCLSQEIPAA